MTRHAHPRVVAGDSCAAMARRCVDDGAARAAEPRAWRVRHSGKGSRPPRSPSRRAARETTPRGAFATSTRRTAGCTNRRLDQSIRRSGHAAAHRTVPGLDEEREDDVAHVRERFDGAGRVQHRSSRTDDSRPSRSSNQGVVRWSLLVVSARSHALTAATRPMRRNISATAELKRKMCSPHPATATPASDAASRPARSRIAGSRGMPAHADRGEDRDEEETDEGRDADPARLDEELDVGVVDHVAPDVLVLGAEAVPDPGRLARVAGAPRSRCSARPTTLPVPVTPAAKVVEPVTICGNAAATTTTRRMPNMAASQPHPAGDQGHQQDRDHAQSRRSQSARSPSASPARAPGSTTRPSGGHPGSVRASRGRSRAGSSPRRAPRTRWGAASCSSLAADRRAS